MEVRKLTAKDVFTVASILGKCGQEATKIMGSLDSKNESAIGLTFISIALQYAEKDIKEWLCSLVGKTSDEFDNLPLDAPLEIVEKLFEQEDIPRFFERARGLFQKIQRGKK